MHFVWNKWFPLHCSDHCCHFSDKGRSAWFLFYFARRGLWRKCPTVSTQACMWAQEGGGREIDRSELKKQRKSYSYPAIIQSRTRHLIYSSLRERNEREWEAGGEREGKRWERCGSRKEIISSRDWCVFMTLSTHTSRETRWTKLSFLSHIINKIPQIVGQQRPWLPKHH